MAGRGNSVEVELKFLGPDLEDVRARLREAGARLEGPRSLETNTTFDDDGQGLRNSEKLLRLRDGRELTVKLPLADDRFKARREITAHIADGEIEEILDALGYRPTWRYEKYREGWDLDGMWVTLDEMPFVGAVVEIEGHRDRIDETARKLGISELETSTGSYRALYEAYRAKHGLPAGDMTFAAESASR